MDLASMFLAGLFFANGIPEFINGPWASHFARPSYYRLVPTVPSTLANSDPGLGNFVLAAVLVSLLQPSDGPNAQTGAAAVGFVAASIGSRSTSRDARPEKCGRKRRTPGDTQIAPGIHLLTDISSALPAPRGNRILVRSADGAFVPDDFRHELMLVLEDEDGLVLLTGCSHHGVLNMVETARRAFPGRPIKALVGGFHFVGIPVMGLFGDNAKAIREVAEQLRAAAIPRILTMHCTERSGYERLRQVIGPTVEYAGVRCSIH